MSKFFLKYFSTILTDFFTGLSLGEMAIFEVQFTTIFGPFDHGLRATIARNRNGMEVTLESFHIIEAITRRFSFKERKEKECYRFYSKEFSILVVAPKFSGTLTLFQLERADSAKHCKGCTKNLPMDTSLSKVVLVCTLDSGIDVG